MTDNRVPLRAWAIKDGEERPAWWITTNNILFRRTDGLQETVRINELTWIAHGRSDCDLKDLFEKKLLYNANGR
jgi:hypothetical protein